MNTDFDSAAMQVVANLARQSPPHFIVFDSVLECNVEPRSGTCGDASRGPCWPCV